MDITWRLLNTSKHSAAMNMAIDEAMLLQQKAAPQPTLRFYDWAQPAFSFGYFQQITAEVDTATCAARNVEIVRRMTGGGTVIHGWDVTYTLIVPHGIEGMPKGISASYRFISDSLIRGFRRLGIPACRSPVSDRPRTAREQRDGDSVEPNSCLAQPAQYDVMYNGKKIAGVSQRRNRIGAMYQSYIALDMPPPELLELTSRQPEHGRILSEKSTAINIEHPTPIARKQLEGAVASGFEEVLGAHINSLPTWVTGELSQEELDSALTLAQTKYATAEWNFRR
jgi:lipoate-protein ligase A